MALSVRAGYNRSGGSTGEIDPLRILAAVDPIASDFDSRVIFSGLWPTMQAEVGTFSVNLPFQGTQGSASGSFYPSRKYGEFPFVYAVYRANQDGRIVLPYIFAQSNRNVYSGAYTFILRDMFQLRVARNGNDGFFAVHYEIDQNGGWGMGGPGVLKIITVGKAP